MKLSLCILAAVPVFGQTRLTLREAVEQARSRYPSVRVSVEQASEAAASIRLARTAYLPKVDTIAQINRATRNNIYGMLLPQTVIAPISGPPNPNNSGTNVWGSAIGFLVSWEPLDFGLRKAGVEAAEASRRRAESSAERTRFETGLAAADAYLTILAAQQTAAAAKANVDRAKTLDEMVGALARADLRPGADAARALAGYAAAQAGFIQAMQAVDVARASLGQFLGVPGSQVTVAAGSLLSGPPDSDAPAPAPAHPAVAEQRLAIEESQARLRVLERSYFPRLNLQGATYSRGTGANPDLTTGGGASGLGPNIYNWGLGVSLTFPLMDYAGLRARKQAEQSRGRAESARMDQIRVELDAAHEKAAIQVEAARRIAATTPIQLQAAHAAQMQAGARYKAGLGTLADVADAERLLTQAEIDDSLARLSVWRAILALRAAEGDIEPFLQAAGR